MFTLLVFVCFVVTVANGRVELDFLDFPYALSLLHYGMHKCGATMIKRNVALTTASCVWPFRNQEIVEEDLKVQAGTDVDYRWVGEIVPVKRLHLFPDDPRILYNVAVLRMKRKFILGAPIEMQPRGAFLPTNYWGNFIGWVLGEVPGHRGLSYGIQKERVKYLGSQDDWRNFQGESHMPSRFAGHKGDPVVTNGKLVGISFYHQIKIREDSYRTLFVNISHPKIFDFITDNAK